MFAVITTSGKQYVVEPSQTIRTEKQVGEPGTTITFAEVLLVADEKGKINLGKPYIKGANVTGEIVKQDRGRTVLVTKYKSKTRYQRNLGHRQYYTDVKITGIKA